MGALEHVRPGQPFRPRADDWNAFVDAARAHREGRRTSGPHRHPGDDSSETVLIYNQTGAAFDRFDVVALGDPLVPPTENEDEFTRRPAFYGEKPSLLTRGRWGIALDPIPAGGTGRARVSGLVHARLYVPAAGADHYDRADAVDGKQAYLRLQRQGPAHVLWRQPGTSADETDLKWAVVRLGMPVQMGCWLRLTAESETQPGRYSWVMLDDDAVSELNPPVTGTDTAIDVLGTSGIRTDAHGGNTAGAVVWGVPYRSPYFESGAEPVFYFWGPGPRPRLYINNEDQGFLMSLGQSGFDWDTGEVLWTVQGTNGGGSSLANPIWAFDPFGRLESVSLFG